MVKGKLKATKRRQLNEVLSETREARVYRRAFAVLEHDRCVAISEVAKTLGVSRQSVHNWITRLRNCDHAVDLRDAPHMGRPARADAVADVLLRTLLKVPPEWFGYPATYCTVSLLRDQFGQSLGKWYSDDTIRRGLHRLGYTWKRPRYVLMPDLEKEKKRQIRRALPGLPRRSVILVEDETDLLLFPPLRDVVAARSGSKGDAERPERQTSRVWRHESGHWLSSVSITGKTVRE